jgi:hypothetical protein
VQAAGDHQVQHQPEIAFYTNRNPLADPPQFADDAAFDIRKRWLCGTSRKGLANRICWIGCARIRGSSALT